MRCQIRFRGRTIIDNTMCYGDLSYHKDQPYIGDFRVHPDTVAQFIGYDCNGDEIYSDDVIWEKNEFKVPMKCIAGARVAVNSVGQTFNNYELVR